MNASDALTIRGKTATFASWCRSVYKLTEAERHEHGIPILSQAELRRQSNIEVAELLEAEAKREREQAEKKRRRAAQKTETKRVRRSDG